MKERKNGKCLECGEKPSAKQAAETTKCRNCQKPMEGDQLMYFDESGFPCCSRKCMKGMKTCAGCAGPMEGETSKWKKDGKYFCDEDCMSLIPGLRGVTRTHLTSAGDHYDIYLETCHSAPVKSKTAFAINGTRFLVRKVLTGEEWTFHFPNQVETFIKEKQDEKN